MGNERPHVIIHLSDRAQSDWVRLILPFMQMMGPNEYGIAPSFTAMPCSNSGNLKKTCAVILQKPTMPGHAQAALMYSKMKKECGFKLVSDMDDLMWDLSPVIRSYGPQMDNLEEHTKQTLRQVLSVFDLVTCSTRYLATRIKQDLGVKNVLVVPNGVSTSLFGRKRRTVPFSGRPRVMYAGNLGHTTEQILGDFEGPWVPWLRKRIENGSIDFYVFGEPHFLKGLEGKYTSIPYTDVMSFPAVAASFCPDFYLAPLVNNSFNQAKSDLKLKEAAALGAVFIGSGFAAGPYFYAPAEQRIGPSATEADLDALFDNLCVPENYMKAIHWQYQMLEEKHWAYEDPEFQKKFVAAYCL